MSIENRNTTHRVVTTAKRIGATLPEAVVKAVEFDPTLPTVPDVADEVASDIASHVGDPKTWDAAVKKGLARVSDAEAADKVRSRLIRAADEARWQTMREHRAEIVDAFRKALADDIATMNAHAAKIPANLKPGRLNLTGLPPAQYRAAYECEIAAGRLEQAAKALAPLYGISATIGSVGQDARMILFRLPEKLDAEYRIPFVRGMLNLRDIRVAGDLANEHAVWYAVLGRLGATFDVVDPSDVVATREVLKAWRIVPKTNGDGGRKPVLI
jgi:hypothetical protein